MNPGWRKSIGRGMQACLPARAFTVLQSYRSRNHQQRWFRQTGITSAAQDWVGHYGCEVRSGPFQGMVYPAASILSRQAIPILLGNYERELHPVIATFSQANYACVIDIGCAEGYYCVGLARLLRLPVYAFDTDFRERRFCRRMAELNQVAKWVRVRGWCSPRSLAHLAHGRRALVICDCEGYETALFCSEVLPSLAQSDLCIELHGEAQRLLPSRLEVSHRLTLIPFTGTAPAAPELDRMGPDAQRFRREIRNSDQTWLWAQVRL